MVLLLFVHLLGVDAVDVRDGAGVVVHALCAFGSDGLGERSLRCTIVAEKELQCPRGLVPECRRSGLALFQYLCGEGDEGLCLILIDRAGTDFLDGLGISGMKADGRV